MELPEIIAAGVYNSRFAAKNVKVSKSRQTSFFEIELPLEAGGVSHIEDTAYPIVPDMIICAKPGQMRHTVFPFQCYYIHMVLHEGPLYNALAEIPDCFSTDHADTYRTLFSKVIKHYNSFSEDSELLVQARVLELLYTLRTDAPRQGGEHKATHQRLIQESLDYIREHLTEDLTLEKVARAMSFSPIYFHNTFKAAVGKTLREYVEEQRIRKATNLLLTTDDSLTKIAFECGFSSQSYFSYVFKRRMNQTPREYVRDAYRKYEI